jgi:hypothetical protein
MADEMKNNMRFQYVAYNENRELIKDKLPILLEEIS